MKRKVKNGAVVISGKRYFCAADAISRPQEGVVLTFYVYRHETRFVHEVNSPTDPDGYLRREFWHTKETHVTLA